MTNVDVVLQQLTTIQATQATHTTMLKNLCADTTEIKAALQHLAKQVADLNRKLDVQIALPPPLPLSSSPPILLTSTATTATSAASSPKSSGPPTIPPPAANTITPPSPKSPPLPPLPPASSPPSSQCPIFVPMQNSVHYQSEACYSAAALHKALGATLGLNLKWRIEQERIVAQDMFVEMAHKLKPEWYDASGVFAEMSKWKYESKRLVFDPGGIIKFERLFAATYDLEDKVNFKAWVMIHINNGAHEW